jgi:hypothetical protein
MTENTEKAMAELSDISEKFQEYQKEEEQKQEDFWNSLSKEDQLKAFCAMSRRICKGELEDQGTYRHVLYGVFKFGPESYMPAQLAGYLSIHNAIYTGKDIDEAISIVVNKCIEICKEGEKTQMTSIGAAEKIRQWFIGSL